MQLCWNCFKTSQSVPDARHLTGMITNNKCSPTARLPDGRELEAVTTVRRDRAPKDSRHAQEASPNKDEILGKGASVGPLAA